MEKKENFCSQSLEYSSRGLPQKIRFRSPYCEVPAKRRQADCRFFEPMKNALLVCIHSFCAHRFCSCDEAKADARIEALKAARDALHNDVMQELALLHEREADARREEEEQ